MTIAAANIGTPQSLTSVSSLTFPHTVAAGVDRLLTVVVGGANNSNFDVSGDYGGVALQFIDFGRTSNSAQKVFLLRQVAPAVGTANVFIDLGATMNAVGAQAITWTGVDQTTPMGSTATVQNSGTQTSGSLAIPSAAGDVIMDITIIASGGSPVISPTAGQTVTMTIEPSGGRSLAASYKTAGAPNTTISWSWTVSGNYGILGVALKPAPAPSGDVLRSLGMDGGAESGLKMSGMSGGIRG